MAGVFSFGVRTYEHVYVGGRYNFYYYYNYNYNYCHEYTYAQGSEILLANNSRYFAYPTQFES